MSTGYAGPVRWARKTQSAKAEPSRKFGKRWLMTFAIVVLAGGLWYGLGRTSQVAKLRTQMDAIQKLPEDQRRAKMAELRPQMEALSRDERRELFANGPQRGRGPFGDLDAYFKLPPEKRIAFLDEQIKKSEVRRKEREKQTASRGPNDNQAANRGGANSANRGPGGPGAAAQLDRLKFRLDNTPPDDRARRSQYIADLNARRIQIGLPPIGRR